MKKIIFNILNKKVGTYLSAIRLSEIFGLSLSFVYELTKNEKIKYREKYGRKEFEVASILEVLEFTQNYNIIEKPLSKEEYEINNFYNWQAQNKIEAFWENLFLDELGEFTSIKELVKLFGVSKTTWYEILEQNKLMYFNIVGRKIVVTRSLIPFLREAIEEKI